MAEVRGASTWTEELASLVKETGIRYAGEEIPISTPAFVASKSEAVEEDVVEPESLKDQVTGFLESWCEMVLELGRGCKDILQQTVVTEDSFIVQKVGGPVSKVSQQLRLLNEFLPEDRDPAHVWPVIFFVFILVLSALNLNGGSDRLVPPVKNVRIHPLSASHALLPDGRRMAYSELGVPANRARFSVLNPHSFLSSRLAGIPGVKESVLEEFGVRLVTYDLPGFGESDPHPRRTLNSSAFDMLHLADALGVNDKFWVLGHGSGSIHAWAALKYIPHRISGAGLFAPMINPYEPSMTKEEMKTTWEAWTPKRKFMYFLARSYPRLLSYSYHHSFLSGKHDRIDKWMAISLGRKDEILFEDPVFDDFYQRDVEESIRQGIAKPFIEEAVLQVSNWGFNLEDLQVQRKCYTRGILSLLMSMFKEPDCQLTGFLGPIHIWQGMDDRVVTQSIADYISRVLPGATMHKVPHEGHFSFFFFCDECHRQIFSTLFGSPQGPLEQPAETSATLSEGDAEDRSSTTSSPKG